MTISFLFKQLSEVNRKVRKSTENEIRRRRRRVVEVFDSQVVSHRRINEVFRRQVVVVNVDKKRTKTI